MLEASDRRSLEVLPSGTSATLYEPSLRFVLARGGSERVFVAAALSGDTDPASLTIDDHYWVALWAAERLVLDEEAVAFERSCARYGTDPVDELQVRDPLLRFEARCAFALLGVQHERKLARAAIGGAHG